VPLVVEQPESLGLLDEGARRAPDQGSQRRAASLAGALVALLVTLGCAETRNLGSSNPHGLLPADARNPIVVINDGSTENWQVEYAIVLAKDGGSPLAGLVVGTSGPWPDLDKNLAGFNGLVADARNSGLTDIPDPVGSDKPTLVRPMTGKVDDTAPNRSPGAQLILDKADELSLPYRPLVVVTGGRLTDVADAYLMDPSIAERIIVFSSLGSTTDSGAAMAAPNGEMDPWADWIVATHLRFVQVSAFYDQLADVPATRLRELPDNPLCNWIRAKQPNIWSLPAAADQAAVIAVQVPSYAAAVQRVSAATPVAAGATAGPDLVMNPNGPAWLVRQSASAEAAARFWQVLADPSTYQP